MLFSVIIPVYNRPQEVDELLQSLCKQTYKNFETLIIEDGSENICKEITERYSKELDIRYYYKENSGQGFSRNYGFERAHGDYFVVFDSDCLIPPNYFKTVNNYLQQHPVDAYGGPDRAHSSFTRVQKAISYAMTSPLTTGGIRGNKRHSGTFHPRSFNMGISKDVYQETGGYRITRMGEDIEFSLHIIGSGFSTVLIEEAFVYHKRRTSLPQFFKQLHFFGKARVNISRFYPNEVKLVHLLPSIFALGMVFFLTLPLWNISVFKLLCIPFFIFCALLFIHSSYKNKNISIGILSIATGIIQLTAYGFGFLQERWTKLWE